MPPSTNNKPKGKRKGKKRVSQARSSSVTGPAGQDHDQAHGSTPGPSNAAAQNKPRSSTTSRSGKRRSSKKSTIGTGSNSSATAGPKMEEDFTEELASQIESAFHIKDETKVELTMPVVPEESESATDEGVKTEDSAGKGTKDENTSEQQASTGGNAFKKRLRALTGGSPKSPPSVLGSDRRRSWQTRSSASLGASSTSAGSDSLKARDANLAGSSSSVGGASGNPSTPQNRPAIEGKRSFTPPSAPLKIRYTSPTDYMLVDMGGNESQLVPKAPQPGLLPKMKDAAQETMAKKAGDTKPSKKYHKSALHIKKVESDSAEGRNRLHELIEYTRNVTGTEVKFRDPKDPNAKQRKDDLRVWDTVNLRCISCRGDCPVCNGACCIYADAKKTIVSENAEPLNVGKAKRIIEIVESLSPRVMDMGTYQLCSQPGGCGRYVCPKCCGVCPNEICRDVQCTECKEDPWGPCDWHD